MGGGNADTTAKVSALSGIALEALTGLITEKNKAPNPDHVLIARLMSEKEQLETALEEQKKLREIEHVIPCVCEAAKTAILQKRLDKNLFLKSENLKAVVVCVDIRKSTDLMLNAMSADAFSKFIQEINEEFSEIFKRNFAVVDKFTGDGILAFFPEFYSGPSPLLDALCASYAIQSAFKHIYEEHADGFKVLLETGVGVGIDYGEVKMVKMNQAITVVGPPVVYACRLAGAPAGCVYLNNQAYYKFREESEHASAEEVRHKLKNGDAINCFKVNVVDNLPFTEHPEWMLTHGFETLQPND